MVERLSDPSPIQAVSRALSSAKRILAVTHINPDGDAIGSLVGIGHIAVTLGIDIRLYCETPPPQHLNWLHSPTPIISSIEELSPWQPDCIIFLDCAEDTRAGQRIVDYLAERQDKTELRTICIDHHISNPNFADINWIDASMGATGMMVALLAKEFGIPLSGDLGEAICLAIISDTGSFSFANTTALALELTAEIVRNGQSMAEFTAKYENHWTLSRMHLWGALMQDVRILCDGKVVMSVVTDEMLKQYNAPTAYLEDYASWLRRLAKTKVVVLVRPKRIGSKISLRSMGDVDVQQIATAFGGGGHKGAAGMDMAEQPQVAADKVLNAIYLALGVSCPNAEN